MSITVKDDTMSLKTGVGVEMTNIDCPKCTPNDTGHHFLYNCTGNFGLEGTIRCLKCGDERSFASKGEFIREIGIGLTYAQSKRLKPDISADRKDDIEEAERANYYRCYKAAAVMCRRSIQLALNDRGIPDREFSKMLEDAHNDKFKLLSGNTYIMAKSIKLYGDKGAHKRDEIDPQEINQAIYMAVEILNELSPIKPAENSQSSKI